jgi:multimeric flavodoxin WrbA
MKVVAFNGSPRKDGNTSILIKHVFKELEKQSIGTELVQLSEKEIRGCIACYKCIENKD